MRGWLGFLMLMLISRGIFAQVAPMEAFINDLMSRMSVEEKIGQLNLANPGDFITGSTVNLNIYEKLRAGQIGSMLNNYSVASLRKAQEIAVNETRSHIPLLFGLDVIHGYKTIFPIPLALSCTWDLELIERTARIAAVEATANGIVWTFSPMVDIARDPRWGRIAEGSGEDPWLGSRVAQAMVKGYQGTNLSLDNTLMACVKHFALYGALEGGRDYNTVDMSRVTMHNDFFPPYKAAVEAGAGSVMTSFNVVDAVPSSGNRMLLTEVLRKQWGFSGFVVSDYTAVNEMTVHGMGDLQQVSALALRAGTDMDMAGEGFLITLQKSLAEGRIDTQDIDRACRRILEAKYKLGLFSDPYRYLNEMRSRIRTFTPEHLEVARVVAAKSMVMLKNDLQVLPLKKSGTIAVIGPLADSKYHILGTWAMTGEPDKAVTILEGIREVAGEKARILYAKGADLSYDSILTNAHTHLTATGYERKNEYSGSAEVLRNEALKTASVADAVIAVLGESAAWSGEAASMVSLGLSASQQDLLKALVSTGKPVVLVLVNGRPLTLLWENENVNSIIEAWAGGTETGHAVADVLFGNCNPSGRLTTTFPMHVGQIPLYYNHKNTGRPFMPDDKFTSKYLDCSNEPLYPFGYGLSYTTFAYGNLTLNKYTLQGNDTLDVTVAVTNTGKTDGEEVVQLYVQDPVASISRPVKELRNFQKIFLQPGETKQVTMQVSMEDLMFYNSSLYYDWEPGDFIIHVGSNARDVKSVGVKWIK
jgi:beta-glucosidase